MGAIALERPVVVIDLETTGTSPYTDRIVEIAAVKVMPDGAEKCAVGRINPGIPIPQEATAIHGITDADVAKAKPFSEIAEKMEAFLDGCDLAGYNIKKFDLPLLEQEFARCGIKFEWRSRAIMDTYLLWLRKAPRQLADAVRTFLGRAHVGAHGAEADARASWDILKAMADKQEWAIPSSPQGISDLCDPPDPDRYDPDGKLRWKGGDLVLTFGKCSGRTLRELSVSDRGLLEWILGKDFSPKVKEAVRSVLQGRHPARVPA